MKDCSDSAVSTASRLEFSRSAGHLNVLPPRRLNESVRRIIDYSEELEEWKEQNYLSLPGISCLHCDTDFVAIAEDLKN